AAEAAAGLPVRAGGPQRPRKSAVLLAPEQRLQTARTRAVELVWALFEVAGHSPYSDGMPGRRIIGVDMGGTKLLAGAVDAGLAVHRRAQRSVTGLDQSSLLDITVEAVEEARESAGEIEAVGFGIPCLIDRRTGRAVIAV